MRRWIPLAMVLAIAALLAGALSLRNAQERVMARYATPLDGRVSNQRHNAVLCLKSLDGTEIPPGGEFSFNKAVGSWSRDKGYRRAPVSYGGLLVDSWGGGVCQTSTTLYNAALLAGLEVVERHRHHYAPTYIAPGRDAAVAFPNIDLVLRNPYDRPVRIAGTVTANGVVVEIVGTNEPLPVRIEQRIASFTPPSELIVGEGRYGRVRNPGHAGYSVETYRTIGSTKQLLSSDSYPVMNKVVEYKPGVE